MIKNICKICVVFVFSFLFITKDLIAQEAAKVPEIDKSPMDISYFPKDYPLMKMNGKSKDLPIARVIYSRPMKKGREIFGGIIQYKEIWRLGANEATEIEFFRNVKIAGKTIAKGRYSLLCIPQPTKWTIIFNRDNYSWGSFNYDAKKDLLRVDCALEKTEEAIEALSIYFEPIKNAADLIIAWDNTRTKLGITW